MATQKILRMPVKLDATGITGNNSNAILEINSTTQGLLPPRMTTTQRTAMSNVEGMLVYDTDLDTLYQNNGTVWSAFGNISGSLSTNFIPYWNGTSLVNSLATNNIADGGIDINSGYIYARKTTGGYAANFDFRSTSGSAAIIGSQQTKALLVEGNTNRTTSDPASIIINRVTSGELAWFQAFDANATQRNGTSKQAASIYLQRSGRNSSAADIANDGYNVGIFAVLSPNTTANKDISGSFNFTQIDYVNNKGAWIAYISNIQVASISQDGVSIGSNAINASAILQADSTTKGFLPPRMTTIQRTAMSNVEGMLVYDTDLDTLYQNNGTAWSTFGNLSGSGLSSTYLTKYNGSVLVNSALSETSTDINAILPINDSSATVASASIINLPQIYNIITGTVNITEIRGAGGITVQNGAVRVLRFEGILNIGGGNPANRVDNGVYGIIATRAGDTAVYRKETNDWVLQSYKRSDGSPLTLGAYLSLTDSSTTVTNTNPIQPVQIGLFTTADPNRGFLMFQNGQGNQLLRPYDGEFWANNGDGGYLALWDGRRIASAANGGNASLSTSIAKYADSNGSQKIEVNIFSINNGPYYHINAILTVDGSGNVSDINIKQPSVNPTAFNVTINAGKAQIVGNNYTLLFYASYRRLTYGGLGHVRVLGIESEKYSTTGLAKYWTGSEGLGVGHTSQNASAILQADSTTKGFLPPRMTAAQMTAIASPATGLIVYQTDGTAGLYQYNGTAWVSFASMSGLSTNYTPYWDGTKLVNSDLYRISGAGQTGGIGTRSARLFQAMNSEANGENALGVYKLINTNIYDAQEIGSNSRGLRIYANNAPAGSASLSYYALRVDNNTTNGSYIAWLQATDKTLAEAQLTAVNSGTIIIRRDGTISSATPPVNYNTGFYFEIRPSTDLTYNKYGNFYLALIDVANKKSGFQFIVNSNKRMTLHEDGGLLIGTGAVPNASAALDVDSTTQGFLPPRMTAAQMTAIASPATGLIVYQTDGTAGLYQYNGTAWVGFGNISGTGLTTNRITKWDGTKLVNANSVDDGVTISSTINRTFTSDTSPVNQNSKFVFTGANTSASAISFIKVALDLQVHPASMGGSAKGMLFLDGGISGAGNNGYPQLYINSGGDTIDTKKSLANAIRIYHRSLDDTTNPNWNSAAVIIDAIKLRPEAIPVTESAGGVHIIISQNADNYVSRINNTGNNGNNPVHYYAKSYRADAWGFYHNKDAGANSGIFSMNYNHVKANVTTVNNGFGYLIRNQIANSNLSTLANLDEQYIAQDFGLSTIHVAKRYFTGGGYVMGLYAGGVIIGNTTALPNASAALDIVSTTKGFLAPRMTATQRVAIVSPVAGLLVYQTDVHAGYWYYDGTTWQDLSQPRVGATASSATPTINTDVTDYYEITGQTVDITSFTTNLTGTPVRGQKLWIDITGTAARAITWGASFEASTIALPTTTVNTNKLSVGFIWNVATSKWRCIGTC